MKETGTQAGIKSVSTVIQGEPVAVAIDQVAAFDETVKMAEHRNMAELPGSELGFAHLRAMLSEVTSAQFTDAKLGRWLGWAQCALVAADVGVTLDDMKALNLRHTLPARSLN